MVSDNPSEIWSVALDPSSSSIARGNIARRLGFDPRCCP